MFKLTTILILGMLSFSLFAQSEVPPAVAQDAVTAPDMIQPLIIAVAAIPKVGPIIVTAFKWIVTIGGIFTALSLAVSGILLTISGLLKVPQVAAIWAQSPIWESRFEKWSSEVKNFNDKAQPYLKYFSNFNVKK